MRWYSSTLLRIPHAMLAKYGGTSLPPFAELNLSSGVGDRPEAVKRNRQLLKEEFGIEQLASAVQVHGDTILCIKHIENDTEFTGADALITNQRGVGLLIQQADCQAILLHDPNRQIIGCVHNGWRGSTLNIVSSTISRMQDIYDVNPADLRAVISPSLGPCCAEFIHYRQELPPSLHEFQAAPQYFDFWKISKKQLLDAGLLETNIDISGLCTSCSEDFFSYRRARRHGEKTTGRNGSFIML